jgi:integrase
MADKLTEAAIKQATPPEQGQRFIFDGHRDAPRGFALRITKAGGKAFVLNYSFSGRQRRKTIGDWPTWSLQAARDEAARVRREVDRGVDVVETERQHRAEPTLADLVARYCREHADKRRSGEDTRRYLERDLLPSLGSMKAKEVRRGHVRSVIDTKAQTGPVAARNLLAAIRHLFNWALERDLVELNPCAGIKVSPARKRERVLDGDEIRSLWHGLPDADMRLLMQLALRLILVTGQRPGEVAGMRWSEIQSDTWIIPAERRGKNEKEHRVPLTPLALQLLGQVRAENERLSKRRKLPVPEALFAFRSNSSLTVDALPRAVAKNRAALGNKDTDTWGHWTPHDLRRTCRTGLSATGVSEEVAERTIGHAAQGIVAVYNQHRYDAEKRAALEAWERRLLKIVGQREAEDGLLLSKH